MAPTTKRIGLSSLVSATLLFSAGVLASNRVKHFIASRGAPEPVPYVNLEYTNEGAFIDKQRFANGRLGGPRCDWTALSNDQRNTYVHDQLARDQTALISSYRELPRTATETFIYTGLARLARGDGTTVEDEVNKLKDGYGFRWNLKYEKINGQPK